MAKLPSGCAGTSTWKKDHVSERWFVVSTTGQTATCIAATQFVNHGRMIDATKGIETSDFRLFLRNYADSLEEVVIPLIPASSPPIEVNPEGLTSDPSDTSTSSKA